MGHIRLGRIPKTKQWKNLFRLLEGSGVDPDALAREVSSAAQTTLLSSEANPAAHYCFWLLTRLAAASRAKDFCQELTKIGIKAEAARSGVELLAAISSASEKEVRRRGTGSVLDQVAELAFRETLSHRIAENSHGLFGSGIEEVQSACREISTQKAFGRVAGEFFARFLSRSIKLVVDKEISNHIGPGKALTSTESAVQLGRDVDRYCSETSQIVQDFAGGWFSKHNWQSKGEILERDVSGFVAHAFEKLQMDLQKGQE